MSCNCKQLKKLEKKIPSILNTQHKKKGIKKFLNISYQFLWKMFGNLIIVFITIITIPIIIIAVILNQFKSDNIVIDLSFLSKKNKLITNKNN